MEERSVEVHDFSCCDAVLFCNGFGMMITLLGMAIVLVEKSVNDSSFDALYIK